MATPAYRQSTPTFTYTNPHPKGIRTVGDCVYRAIAIATGKSWLEVYDELTTLGRELLAPPNDPLVYGKYLDSVSKKTVDVKYDTPTGKKRRTPRQLAQLHPTKTYVVSVANHVVAVKGGKVRDTWDSGYKSAYKVWEL